MFQAFSSTFTSISPALRERGRVWEKVDGTLLGRGVACGRAGEACGRAGSRLAGRAGARRAGVTCGRAGAGRAGSAESAEACEVWILPVLDASNRTSLRSQFPPPKCRPQPLPSSGLEDSSLLFICIPGPRPGGSWGGANGVL